MPDGQEIRVQDEQGNVHVFPAGSTPQMIARAMKVKGPAAAKSKIGTGEQFIKDRPGKGITLEGSGGELWEGVKGIVKSSIPQSGSDVALDALFGGPMARMTRDVATSSAREMKSAYKDPKAKWWEVPLAGLGPFVGMSSERARESAERGEGGKIIGQAAIPLSTMAAAAVVPRAVSPIRAMMKRASGSTLATSRAATLPKTAADIPSTAVTQQEVLAHAAKEGINLTPGQATGTPVARYAQAVGERSVLGGNQLAEAMEENAGRFVKAVDRFADRIDPKRGGLSADGAGETIQQAAKVAKDVTHENASAAYKQLGDLEATSVLTKGMRDRWIELRGRLPLGAEEQILGQVPRELVGYVKEMLAPDGLKFNINFKQAIDLRSVFRELGDADALPDRVQGAFREMTKSIDGAMESAANKAGFGEGWRKANAGWKRYNELYGDRQSPLYKILKTKDPAQVTQQLLNRKSVNDVTILREQGMEGALDAMKRQVLQDIWHQKFRITRGGLGGYSDGFLKTLFGPDAKELYLKGNIARRFSWQENPSGTSNVLLAAEQFRKPSTMAAPMGAARFSMPRNPLSYLMQPRPLRAGAGVVAVPGALGEGQP